MSDLTLRSADDGDRDAIARIWLDGWRSTGIRLADEPDYAGLRARVDAELASGWLLVVAELDGRPVGFAALRPDARRLDQLFVAPDWLGQGIGGALMAAARGAMPEGFDLWTHADNGRARRFYEGQGPARHADGLHPRHGHPIRTYWFGGTNVEADESS